MNYALDPKEERALKLLDEKYQRFTKKSLIGKSAEKVMEKSKEIVPIQWQDYFDGIRDGATDTQIWKKVMELASDGFVALQGIMSKYTIRESDILKRLNKVNPEINSLDRIFNLKSYEIEKVISSHDWKVYTQNILQAAPTGFVGMAGIPFNLVLATFIQFRTIQLIAMHYGYNVKSSQSEMDYASAVYLQIISKGALTDVDGYGEIISKMMAQAELSSLRNALKTKSYSQMAAAEGIQLLYVQMRAITNKAAGKALDAVGQKNMENQALRKILESLSKNMGQKVGAKYIPVLSAILSVLIDTHQINKVIRLANVIYQKRFLLDKEMHSYMNSEENAIDTMPVQ